MNPPIADSVSLSSNQVDSTTETNPLERVSTDDAGILDADFHGVSAYLTPDEDTPQNLKVSQRELASLGSVNAVG